MEQDHKQQKIDELYRLIAGVTDPEQIRPCLTICAPARRSTIWPSVSLPPDF